jgi:hypothetical protein
MSLSGSSRRKIMRIHGVLCSVHKWCKAIVDQVAFYMPAVVTALSKSIAIVLVQPDFYDFCPVNKTTPMGV